MNKQLDQVKQFRDAFLLPINESPALPPRERCKMLYKILQEEVYELDLAMTEEDLTESLDAITDCLYILFGISFELGLHNVIEQAFDEVHRSNMTKLGADGKPIYREDGKVMKSELFEQPNLKQYVFAK